MEESKSNEQPSEKEEGDGFFRLSSFGREHRNFTSFCDNMPPQQPVGESEAKQLKSQRQSRRNLVDALKELELEAKLGYNERTKKTGRFGHSGGLGLSKRQKQVAIGVLKGYKVRRTLSQNSEIAAMIQQIRMLEGLNDGQELPSIKIELMRKKTILIHTLHR